MPPGVPGFGLTSRATSPVAELDATLTVTGTAVPCVVLAGTVSDKVVVVGVKVTLFQSFTRFAAFTDPRPVARS